MCTQHWLMSKNITNSINLIHDEILVKWSTCEVQPCPEPSSINTGGRCVNKTQINPNHHHYKNEKKEKIGQSGGMWYVAGRMWGWELSECGVIDAVANEIWHMASGQETPGVMGKMGVSESVQKTRSTPMHIAYMQTYEKAGMWLFDTHTHRDLPYILWAPQPH